MKAHIEGIHQNEASERNRLGKTTSRLNTTGKVQNDIQGEGSMGNLAKEINDLIQRQKENLKVDFDKAKENVMRRGMAAGVERKTTE